MACGLAGRDAGRWPGKGAIQLLSRRRSILTISDHLFGAIWLDRGVSTSYSLDRLAALRVHECLSIIWPRADPGAIGLNQSDARDTSGTPILGNLNLSV
jgi:hypothetical protein